MNKMSMQVKSFKKLGITLALILTGTGCAQHPVNPDMSMANAPSSNSQAQSAAQKTAKAVLENPVSIEFDKLSIKLDDADKKILVQLSERVKAADRILITGYCDRKQVGNAKAAALARAAAVKNELVPVDPNVKQVKPVQIKYSTEIANKHAVEVKFE